MKMEKGLDDIFKKGLNNLGSSAEYREQDWDALEAMLDAKEKKRGIVLWLPVISGVAALCLLFAGWYFMRPNFDKGQHVVKITPKLPANGGNNTAPVQQLNSNVVSGTVKNNNVNEAIKNNAATANSTIAATGNKKQGMPTRLVSNSGSNYRAIAANGRKVKSNTARAIKTLNNDNLPDNSSTVASAAVKNADLLYAVNQQQFASLAEQPLTLQPTLVIPSMPKGDQKTTGTEIANGKKFRLPQMALTLIASPDVNGVNSLQSSQVGANVGLMFSVRVFKKLTVSSGAIYAKTPYSTDFSNYSTFYKFKTNPEYVNADCRVLDIPINLDYQVYSKNRNKLSIGSGLSSYLMLRENYTYSYANPGTYGPGGVEYVNRNKHYFGVLNIDATYQRQLNSKISIGIQPYLKLPLTGIGYGQVKLQTAGVAVGISWNINSLSKP